MGSSIGTHVWRPGTHSCNRDSANATVALAAAVVVMFAATGAGADVYRWTDVRGEVHYSGDPNDAPAGVQAERLHDFPSEALPTQPVGKGTADHGVQEANEPAEGQEIGTGPSTQAEVDTGRIELQNEYRETRARIADVERQIDALTRAQEDPSTAHVGEEAVKAFDQRDEKAVKLQVERQRLAKEVDKIRTRYADLQRRALAAYGGRLPSWWEELPDSP